MSEAVFPRLLAFLEKLDELKIRHYRMEHTRPDSVMITVVSPGVYWEVEFLDDGTVDVERYYSRGRMEHEEALGELFEAFSDEPDVAPAAIPHPNAVVSEGLAHDAR